MCVPRAVSRRSVREHPEKMHKLSCVHTCRVKSRGSSLPCRGSASPPSRRPLHTLSKNGVRMGRPPAQTTPKKAPKKFDAPAYAVFLEELAEAVRTVLGVGPDVPVQCLQDGAKFHWGPEAKKVAAELLLQFFKDFPAYSPDLNPIENVFSILEAELAKEAVRKAAKSVAETEKRAQRLMARISKTDYIANMVNSMPNRLQEVIKAKGSATRY